MLKAIKNLYLCLTAREKKKLIRIQFLIAVTAFLESIGILSVGPYIGMAANQNLICKDGSLTKELCIFLDVTSPNDFLFIAGVIIFIIIAIGVVFSLYTLRITSLFSQKVGITVGNRLLRYYIDQDIEFHQGRNSAELTKKITVEVTRLTGYILNPLLQLNTKIITTFFIILALLIYDIKSALIGIGIFSICYLLLYKIAKKRLMLYGDLITKVLDERFKITNSSLMGIREIIILNQQKHISDLFDEKGFKLAYSQGMNYTLALAPRYIMEFFILGGITVFIVYTTISMNLEVSEIMPALIVYAFAGLKLLPSFQGIYNSISTIKGNLSSFYDIQKDLNRASIEIKEGITNAGIIFKDKKLEFIQLKNVSYKYSGSESFALKNINLKINQGEIIGVIGSSGSGKSTLIDILIGFIEPTDGMVLVNDVEINKNNKKLWQDNISILSQKVYIFDDTLANNIALRFNNEEIDEEKLNYAVNFSNLNDLFQKRRASLGDSIGEDGIKLSGGQRQRLGIARVIYRDSEVMIFDEGTSALDPETEGVVLDNIYRLREKKTIIIVTHKPERLKQCNSIIQVKKGRIVNCGTYESISKHEDFDIFNELERGQ